MRIVASNAYGCVKTYSTINVINELKMIYEV